MERPAPPRFLAAGAAGDEAASRGAGSLKSGESANGGRSLPGIGSAVKAGEGAPCHPRLQFGFHRNMLPPPGLQGAGLAKAPRVPRGLVSTASPLLVLVSPSPLRVRHWKQNGVERDLEKPPRLHCSGPGGAGSPEPSPRGAFSSCGSQVLGPASVGRCGLAGAREPERGLGGAHPDACSAAGRSARGGDCD